MEISHGICEECERIMTDEFIRAEREWEPIEPYHDGKCRGPFDFIEGQLAFAFVIFILCFLVIMAAEGLHWLTGGEVPELIQWHPKEPASSFSYHE